MGAAFSNFGKHGWPYRNARPASVPRPRVIRGRYDAAQTINENRRHWANADELSAREANSSEVRRKLRSRARYECSENNSYAWGIVQTLANDTIGTGPRLQLTGPDLDNNKAIERAFGEWSDEIGLAEKLRTMRQARAVDGEAFALFTTNPNLSSPVQLDLLTIEADQVATPFLNPLDTRAIDGLVLDRYGNPEAYHILDEHPGDSFSWAADFGDYHTEPARFVLHWYRKIRAGQFRGVPDVTPALPLFAQLRRYTLAVLAAAETAADFAAVLYSELSPDSEDLADGEPFETLEIERRMMTTLPAGWKMGQFKAEQPTTTYEMFKRELLNEIARCLNMPYNVAAGNSSAYNYASGRLDWQTYFKALEVDQHHLRVVALDRILAAWLVEAKAVTRLVPGEATLSAWPHEWIWPGIEHVDPQKEANAQAIRLANGMTSFDEECARQGVDPDTRAENIAKGLDRWKRLGIDPPAYVQPAMPAASGANADE